MVMCSGIMENRKEGMGRCGGDVDGHTYRQANDSEEGVNNSSDEGEEKEGEEEGGGKTWAIISRRGERMMRERSNDERSGKKERTVMRGERKEITDGRNMRKRHTLADQTIR